MNMLDYTLDLVHLQHYFNSKQSLFNCLTQNLSCEVVWFP